MTIGRRMWLRVKDRAHKNTEIASPLPDARCVQFQYSHAPAYTQRTAQSTVSTHKSIICVPMKLLV